MKIAIVVQRYGADINGGAELHARYIAERLAPHADVEVMTTCARDYITWRNELTPGEERVHDIRVRRFPVTRERDPHEFGRLSERVFDRPHTIQDELHWLDSEGPTSPALVRHVGEHGREFDYVLFFSARYYHAFHGARTVPERAILVPTAERDPALGVTAFQVVFRGVRALMYNSFEERALITAIADNDDVPGVVVGVGSEIPAQVDPLRFRQKYDVRGPFVIYVGRIDENKGCGELFRYFEEYARTDSSLSLLLIGNPVLPVPDHPRIRHLGFIGDEDKFDAIAACTALIMPSYFESLSMVALEAWALGRPVLANGHCDVLAGQCLRSNAGLFYTSFEEFAETLQLMVSDRDLADALGHHGRDFFRQHYTWPVIVQKYLDMFDRLNEENRAGRPTRMERLPGWLSRRYRVVPPAATLVNALPAGPARGPSRGRQRVHA